MVAFGGFRVAAVLVAAANIACSGLADRAEPAELVATRAEPVIGGSPDPGESGTVYVTHLDYPFLCSGTLIGATLVVTAKHCTFRERADGTDAPLTGSRFRVGFGPAYGQLDWRGTTSMEWIGMPGELEVQPAVDAGEDVALLWLSSAMPAGARIHSVKLDYVPAVGDPITIVGYGRSSLTNDQSGVKLMTTDSVNGVIGATGIIQTQGKGACSGDSGGSFFFGANRDLVGITSTAGMSEPDRACDLGITHAGSVRNQRVSQFLQAALARLGVCAPSPEICGDGRDQDCDGIADNQCQKDGQPCGSDVDCASGVCAEIAGQRICARACDERTPCPAANRCVSSCTQGFCVAGAQGTGKLLAPCSDSAECASNHCAASGCSLICNPLLGQCPDDMACSLAAGCGECATLAGVPGPRQLGERCASGADCAGGAECVDDGFGVRRCATLCLPGDVCPGGFSCRRGQCLRGGGLSSGERCLAPEDCASNLCALFPDKRENYCAKPCSSEIDCSNGLECREELGARICVPVGRRMGESCTHDDECTTRRCIAALGVCSRQCNPSTIACPPGFLCEVVAGELACVQAPEVEPDAGSGGAGGVAGAAGQPQAGADGGAAAPGFGSSSGGCGCRATKGRGGSAPLALFSLLIAAGARRQTRRP
jgi:hypothetical protein